MEISVTGAMRMVADLLDEVAGLPGYDVEVEGQRSSSWSDHRPRVSVWMGTETDPRERFPAVARLALHMGLDAPTFRPGSDRQAPDGIYAAHGDWRGTHTSVFTACTDSDPNRFEDAIPPTEDT
ncbi:hypothetical protein ACIQWR_37865 [Streptomyces sp. NPDC098789]|uniref:hypothetical protein n=1 Tax=Streptomyces sp. NPDC098789 TaxID=3366098 RepID=UPI00381655D1